jgi:hypothetical protein
MIIKVFFIRLEKEKGQGGGWAVRLALIMESIAVDLRLALRGPELRHVMAGSKQRQPPGMDSGQGTKINPRGA